MPLLNSVLLYCFTPDLYLIFFKQFFFGYRFDCDARGQLKSAKLTERRGTRMDLSAHNLQFLG
jgi:hypothetical protein